MLHNVENTSKIAVKNVHKLVMWHRLSATLTPSLYSLT